MAAGVDIGDQVWLALDALNQVREQMRNGINVDKQAAVESAIAAFLVALAAAINPE